MNSQAPPPSPRRNRTFTPSLRRITQPCQSDATLNRSSGGVTGGRYLHPPREEDTYPPPNPRSDTCSCGGTTRKRLVPPGQHLGLEDTRKMQKKEALKDLSTLTPPFLQVLRQLYHPDPRSDKHSYGGATRKKTRTPQPQLSATSSPQQGDMLLRRRYD